MHKNLPELAEAWESKYGSRPVRRKKRRKQKNNNKER
jgi:hypothetical protein